MDTPPESDSSNADVSELQAQIPPPPAPPPPGRFGKVWAIVGIVAGFFFLIVPGVLAIRSYRRWRAGSIDRPALAWTFASIGVASLVLGIFSSWALYHLPLVQDDFSDPASGWPNEEGLDSTFGYEGGAYHIEAQGSDPNGVYLVWGEGARPNVAVEVDVLLPSGDGAAAAAGVGCHGREDLEYVFVVGGGEFAIVRFDERVEALAMGQLPPQATGPGSSTRIRGECRAGSGETTLTMYVNGTKVAEATEPDDERYHSFTAIRLFAVSGDEAPIDVRFDNAYVIAIQPS